MTTAEYYKAGLGPHYPLEFKEPKGIDMVDPTPYPSIQEVLESYARGERIQGLPTYYEEFPVAVERNIDLSDIAEAQNVIAAQEAAIMNPPAPPAEPPAPAADPSPAVVIDEQPK